MVTTNAILSMKALATDPKKRAALSKDKTCIGGLVVVLSNKDTKIVILALETLLLLAESPENCPGLRDFIGMMDQLECLLRHDDKPDVKDLAEKLYLLLTTTELLQQTPLKDSSNTQGQSSRRNSSFQKNRSLLANGKYKNMILQIRGMINVHDRDLCMRLLLHIKGVVSITFDLNKKRCILKTKSDVKPEALVHAISKSQTMIAQQVVKEENGEEMLLSFGAHGDDADKENSELPDYLSDDADSPVVDTKAMARTGDVEKKKGGWIRSAASFLTNSFYW
ncbi:armadillo repeat-containing protein 1-like [Gigantopelta aegis]|uniref:armadillo repeat-containing protein 1-like n=1 Tax=Gigantopelta aegis TaxID=1735272 RepID=UPI001B88CAB6|nr:armadillo repeat-containing protein 1-like [Gigantopelta aegis]